MQIHKILNNKNIRGIIATALIILILVYAELHGDKKASNYRKKIIEDSILTTGVVTKIISRYKQGYEINFEFTVKGEKRGGMGSSGKYEPIKNIIVGKTFPVIANYKDPSYSEILITPDDFENYNMRFPDSLNWVRGW